MRGTSAVICARLCVCFMPQVEEKPAPPKQSPKAQSDADQLLQRIRELEKLLAAEKDRNSALAREYEKRLAEAERKLAEKQGVDSKVAMTLLQVHT